MWNSRRQILQRSACGFGSLAAAGLLCGPASASTAESGPLAPRQSHFPATARRVIFLFMHGGVSHVDSFDPKPKLEEMNGRPLPFDKPKFEFGGTGNLLASPWKFRQYGDSGIPVSDLFPQIGGCIDDIAVIRSMNGADFVSHGPALLNINTGSGVFARPCLGAWALYGLGSENQNLPGFLSLSPSLYHGGAQNYGSAFLPATFQGTRLGDGSTNFRDARLSSLAPGEDPQLQRLQLDLLKKRNQRHLQSLDADSALEARMESFEMAFRMQAEAPEVMDISRETSQTLAAYGVDAEPTDEFARQCLLARRCVEAGVRFVQVMMTGQPWDTHSDNSNQLRSLCKSTDGPVAALLSDLKRRGMLEDTLVIWTGEFGRTPFAEGKDGRDHHKRGFSMWMAGGGIRGGVTHGATDDFGYQAVKDVVTVADLHGTILQLLGLDYRTLTFRYDTRDQRLTDVHTANIVNAVIS